MTAGARAGLFDEAGTAVTGVISGVQALLPTRRLPVYLAAGALLVTGLVDPPAALGAGLGYEALRRWGPTPPRNRP